MVERKKELKRRNHRKMKMRKLKTKLATAKEPAARDLILSKIHRLSPAWVEPETQA